VDSFRPGLTYFHQVADDGEAEIWSNDERTWHLAADGIAETLPAPTRYFVRAHEFHLLLLEVDTRFSGHRLGTWSEVGERRCRLIEMEDESARPASLCVADSDGLPLRLELNPEGAEGPVRVTFDDWRPLDGLSLFHRFDLSEGPARTFSYDYERLETNTVTADRFVTPARPDRQEDQEALLAILRDDRRAHLETDAVRLASHLADRVVQVSDGEIEVVSRDEVEALFSSIFAGAVYELWEDTRPPVIRFSSDGDMAWVARRVRARRRAATDAAAVEYTSAYTATYETLDGDWRMTSVTSTFAAP
jgi:ketosteroid isomerase-like protein